MLTVFYSLIILESLLVDEQYDPTRKSYLHTCQIAYTLKKCRAGWEPRLPNLSRMKEPRNILDILHWPEKLNLGPEMAERPLKS